MSKKQHKEGSNVCELEVVTGISGIKKRKRLMPNFIISLTRYAEPFIGIGIDGPSSPPEVVTGMSARCRKQR